MIRSFPPHPNPLPPSGPEALPGWRPGERVGHSSPQQSWGVFWNIFINSKLQSQMIETISFDFLNFGHWNLFGIWPACAKPRHAGRRQVLGIWCLTDTLYHLLKLLFIRKQRQKREDRPIFLYCFNLKFNSQSLSLKKRLMSKRYTGG